jgi:hypothetical protein
MRARGAPFTEDLPTEAAVVPSLVLALAPKAERFLQLAAWSEANRATWRRALYHLPIPHPPDLCRFAYVRNRFFGQHRARRARGAPRARGAERATRAARPSPMLRLSSLHLPPAAWCQQPAQYQLPLTHRRSGGVNHCGGSTLPHYCAHFRLPPRSPLSPGLHPRYATKVRKLEDGTHPHSAEV